MTRYWPLGAGRMVTSEFGPRSDGFHFGADFGRTGGSSNMPVYAAQAGTVVMAGPASGFGHWVVVDHPTDAGSGTTVYGHVIPEVAVGQEVAAGERIAYIDPDEDTNGGVAPHLHFEAHRSVWVPPGPDRLDPLPWLAGAREPGSLTHDLGGTVNAPAYTELDRMGNSRSSRWGSRVTNFLLHTQEGGGTAESLAAYLNDPANGVSYHYTIRDGILCAVVDTDYASWSVLDANAQTINLCFAGSRASWSRAQWLAIENDLRIAAWIAVQDARRYGFATDVIAPPYTRRDGISDHQYVTDCLGIGSHTDVGRGFPWDVFERHVQAAVGGSTEEDDMTPEQAQQLADVHRELTQKYPSRSTLRENDKPVDTMAGMLLNADGRVHEASVFVPAQLDRIEAALAALPDRIAAAIKEGGKA